MDDGEFCNAQREAHECPREGWRGEYDREQEYEGEETSNE